MSTEDPRRFTVTIRAQESMDEENVVVFRFKTRKEALAFIDLSIKHSPFTMIYELKFEE